jgi:acetyl esterase/lipase
VIGVCGLAPWLPSGEPLPALKPEARFVIAHGTADRMTSAPLSMSYARRLRHAGGQVARFEFPGGRHALLDEPLLWHRFAVRTTLGLVGDQALPPAVAAALSTDSTDLGQALSSALADG